MRIEGGLISTVFGRVQSLMGCRGWQSIPDDWDQIAEYALIRINDTAVLELGFKVIHVQNILPGNFYRKIVSFMNTKSNFRYLSKNYISDTRKTNDVFFDLNREYDPSDNDQRSNFLHCLNYITLKINIAIFEKLYNGGVEEEDFRPFQQILCRARNDFSIEVHAHPAVERTNALLYLPTTDRDWREGSVVYLPKRGMDPHYDPKQYNSYSYGDFEEVYKASYVPNTLVAWRNSADSPAFHGSGVVESPMWEKKRYIFFGALSGNEGAVRP